MSETSEISEKSPKKSRFIRYSGRYACSLQEGRGYPLDPPLLVVGSRLYPMPSLVDPLASPTTTQMEEIGKTLHSFGDSVKVRVSSPSELSLKQKVAAMVETDVLISPSGGRSMLTRFLPPGAVPLSRNRYTMTLRFGAQCHISRTGQNYRLNCTVLSTIVRTAIKTICDSYLRLTSTYL